MSEERLKQVAEVIAAKRVNMTHRGGARTGEAGAPFKQEKGRLPR